MDNPFVRHRMTRKKTLKELQIEARLERKEFKILKKRQALESKVEAKYLESKKQFPNNPRCEYCSMHSKNRSLKPSLTLKDIGLCKYCHTAEREGINLMNDTRRGIRNRLKYPWPSHLDDGIPPEKKKKMEAKRKSDFNSASTGLNLSRRIVISKPKMPQKVYVRKGINLKRSISDSEKQKKLTNLRNKLDAVQSQIEVNQKTRRHLEVDYYKKFAPDERNIVLELRELCDKGDQRNTENFSRMRSMTPLSERNTDKNPDDVEMSKSDEPIKSIQGPQREMKWDDLVEKYGLAQFSDVYLLKSKCER